MALDSVVYNKAVDVAQSMPVPVIFAKQGEHHKRKVVVKIMEDGQPFKLVSGNTAYVQGATAEDLKTKQRYRFKYNIAEVNFGDSTITFYIDRGMTQVIGITQCELAIYDSGAPDEILCTANINIEVQGTGMSPQDEMASDDYQAIVSIKAEVTAMRDEVRTKTNQAIAAAKGAAQNAYNSALGVQKIVAGNEAYTKQEADLKHSVAPRKAQTSTTGELKLTDADYGLSYLELQGNSEQYTNTANKNLFDMEYQDLYGVKNRYLDINGNLTVSGGVLWSVSYYIKVKPGTKYFYRGVSSSTIAATCFYDKDKVFISGIINSDLITSGKILTTPSNCEWIRTSFYTSNDSGMQIEEGETETAYIQGTVDAPSPEYPSEVKSVGDIPKDSNGVEIRNLLDEDYLKNPDHWSIEGSNVYYVKLSSSTAKLLGAAYKMLDIRPDWKSSLYLSEIVSTGANTRIILIDISGVVGTGAYTFPSTDTIYLVGYNRNNDTMTKAQFIDEIFRCYKFMVTSAAEIDEYRPYIGENNGLVKIESSGVNKVDVGQKPVYDAGTDNINIITWTPQEIILEQKIKGTSYAYADVDFVGGKTYSIYCRAQAKVIEGSATLGATRIGFGEYRPKGAMYGQIDVVQDGEYHDCYAKTTLPEDVNRGNFAFMLYVNAISAPNGNVRLTVKDLMIVEGDKTLQEMKALKYQPYYNKVTWIPLREPLRALYDYDGGSIYIKDSIDKNGNVIQRVERVVYDGTENFSGPAQFKNLCVYIPVNDLRLLATSRIFCENLKVYSNITGQPLGTIGVAEEGVNPGIRGFFIGVYGIATTLEEFKQWLSENNVVVYYELKKENYINYQIPAIYIETYDQETNVRCSNKVKPSSMGLDYKIAISSLIKRLEALESAAVNNGGK